MRSSAYTHCCIDTRRWCRKSRARPYVWVKADFQRELHFPTQLLGYLDTTFLVSYGVGLLFSGSVGARFGNKLAGPHTTYKVPSGVVALP